ncbi:MAG: TetR/AcrR family transcriptional regulator [Hyphomicrobiales bacterium]|nr:MAG: TetR/AcrR family transcriptional regulator [Hyphomicrobiales bacterium]
MRMTNTRQTLIAAAQAELIAGHGHLEMQAVARRAKVSVGLAYHHFGSKSGLIAAVVEAFYAELNAAAFDNAEFPAGNWAEREKARIGAYVAFHYAHPFAPLVIGALSRSPEVLDVETAFTNQTLTGGEAMIRAAQRDGSVRADLDPALTIALMSGGIRQAMLGALTRVDRPDPDALTEAIWSFMAAALRPAT